MAFPAFWLPSLQLTATYIYIFLCMCLWICFVSHLFPILIMLDMIPKYKHFTNRSHRIFERNLLNFIDVSMIRWTNLSNRIAYHRNRCLNVRMLIIFCSTRTNNTTFSNISRQIVHFSTGTKCLASHLIPFNFSKTIEINSTDFHGMKLNIDALGQNKWKDVI